MSSALWTMAWSIAVNTFREAIRNRILHGIILLALVLVVGSFFLGRLSVENDARVIRDLGMTFINLIVVLVAIFSGVNLLYVEIQRKTIYTIVTKPVPRWSFILGKYLGLVLTLAAVQALISLVLVALFLIRGDPIGAIHLQSLALILAEGSLVAALATLFSSFSTPFLSALFTFGIFLLGRLREALYIYAEKFHADALGGLIKGLGVVIPDLTLHRYDHQLAYLVPMHWDYMGYTLLYTAAYIMVTVILSCVIFSRRDFI
jgi:ABC-type transport system involved in multi-copper enzyme maturation permease subunit